MTHKRLVVLTGAGMSRESGLQTFRDSDGLWNGHDVFSVCSVEAWNHQPEIVLDFYNARRKEIRNAVPNLGHKSLAKLEQYFEVTVITQNIDDLHERAGSSNVIHLHGEILVAKSESNDKLRIPWESDLKIGDIGSDGAQLRPHVVFFGEAVPMLEQAAEVCELADIFVIVGTSLQVYPAAGLISVTNAPRKYLVDPNPPDIPSKLKIIKICAGASEGMDQLFKILTED